MYSCPSICTPFKDLGNGNDRFQFLLNHPLNHRYRVLKHLGQSELNQTFFAVDEHQNSLPCVVKQVSSQSDTTHHQTTPKHFHQEVKRLAELSNHSQLPKLLNSFEEKGYTFIVQEWIDGWTLAEEAADMPFNEAEVWEVLQAVLPVLQYLHDRQIIHQAIKPANIIRHKRDRQLVLVGFEVGKTLTQFSPIQTETMIGGVEYAAPEQIKGQAVFASDLYSLGLTCLHLLTQTSPFELYDIVEADWKWQAYLPQPITANLKAILCKLLQPAIRRRYQSATEVLNDLQAASVLISEQQSGNPLSNPLFTTTPSSSEVDQSLGLKSISHFIDKSPSVSGVTIYLPPTQDWYYLPGGAKNSGAETQATFFLSPRLAAAANTPSVQNASLFAEEIASLQALPLVRRVLLASISAAIGSVAMACLVFCLGTILFALSTPPPSGMNSLKNNQPTLKSF